jgi:hypothetical protein
MWPLGQRGRRDRPDSNEAGGGDGREKVGEGSRGCMDSIWVLTCGGEVTGGRARWRLCSGEPAVRPGQQASVGALVVQEEGRRNTGWRRRRPEGRARRGRQWRWQWSRGVSASREEGWRWPFYRRARVGEAVTHYLIVASSRHGQWGRRRRARVRQISGVRRCGNRRVGGLHVSPTKDLARVTHREKGRERRTDHRTWAGLSVRAQRVPSASAPDAGATARSKH